MSVCRNCNKAIIWGIMPDGHHIPLDPKQPVYLIVDQSPNVDGSRAVSRAYEAMVFHQCAQVHSVMYSRGPKSRYR